jgi:hypothetical protein
MNKDFITLTYIVAANIMFPTEQIMAITFTTIALFILTDILQWKTKRLQRLKKY